MTIKEEEVEITYSYWDGSGHRKTITMKKGNSIYQFLCKVLDSIRPEFPELKIVSGDQLIYVKEDLISSISSSFILSNFSSACLSSSSSSESIECLLSPCPCICLELVCPTGTFDSDTSSFSTSSIFLF